MAVARHTLADPGLPHTVVPVLRGGVWWRRMSLVLCSHEGPRRDGAMTGGGWPSLFPLCAKKLVPLAMQGPARVHPSSALEEELEGTRSIPIACRCLPAQCPPAAPGLSMPCSHTPALGELGLLPKLWSRTERGEKTSLSPRAPWSWWWPELPCREGVSLKTSAAGPNHTSAG